MFNIGSRGKITTANRLGEIRKNKFGTEMKIIAYRQSDDIDEAIQYARENKCDEVEETAWDSEESYQNYEPADRFRTVWERD